MTTPAFAHLATLLSRTPVFAEKCNLILDGEVIEKLTARFTHKETKEQVTETQFMVHSEPVIRIANSFLPRPLQSGDLVEKADGTTWRISSPEDSGAGTTTALIQELNT